jgi:lipoyl(octanoyl) transferase
MASPGVGDRGSGVGVFSEDATSDPRPSTSDLGSPTPLLHVHDLGLIPYEECWELQRELSAAVGRDEIREQLLILEHPHTYTCGRRGGRDHILAGEDELRAAGVTVLDVDRGGDVTYHGPGQLVAYPVIRLASRSGSFDYPGYVRALERVLIGSLADFEIRAHQIEGYSGAWVAHDGRDAKIAAIGVKVDARGITTHGIALNVNPDLHFFHRIVPCGITDKGVTSMAQLLPTPPNMALVKASFVEHFCSIFDFIPQV